MRSDQKAITRADLRWAVWLWAQDVEVRTFEEGYDWRTPLTDEVTGALWRRLGRYGRLSGRLIPVRGVLPGGG